eukprot:c19982_g1_i1 orf=464-1246(+)
MGDLENDGVARGKYGVSTESIDTHSQGKEGPCSEHRFTMSDPQKELKEPANNLPYAVREPPNEPSRTSPISATRVISIPSTSLAMHGRDRRKIAEAILRIATAIFSLIAFLVMANNHQTGTELGTKLTFHAKFSDFQAYSYLLGMNLLAFVYSTAQVFMWGLACKQGYIYSPTFNLALAVFICDKLMALLLFSASSSAATVSILSQKGVGSIWPSICTVWQVANFCSQAEGAVGMSFFSSFCIIASALFSGYNLVRLMTN